MIESCTLGIWTGRDMFDKFLGTSESPYVTYIRPILLVRGSPTFDTFIKPGKRVRLNPWKVFRVKVSVHTVRHSWDSPSSDLGTGDNVGVRL